MQKLGKYEILTELGHGAMGVVYKARDPFIGRLVALKTINSSLVDRPDLLERFYQEAQSAGKLQHPNIVTVFELGQEKDTPFIAMEYLDGDSLEKTIVRQTELPLALKVGYIVRICQALEYAHKNRVVHRDIKPGNIMVNSEGVVKVVDFGIARLVDFSRTHTNMMIGTPAYMAPELFRKKKADERTDIWAVGVTFYELICYQRPFTGDGYDIIRTIMEDEFPPISSIVPDCHSEIESIIQRMLRKQAADRYQSMEDVLLDLEPVWNQLRANAAVSLAERARELYDLGDLPTAYDAVRRARQIDPSNALVKSLLEKINTEIRRSEIQPKVQEHLSRGRSFLQSGQFPEAQAEAEAALGLDSHHELAQKLVAEVEAAAARARQLEQKLRLTKQRLAEGALVEAQSALRQAIDLDPSHPQTVELKHQIEEEQTRRERRKQLSEILHRARELWTDLKYDECLALTTEGLKAFPNEPELRNLHETTREDQAEQKKQVHISEVRRLLGQRKLADARKALEVLTREQPQDTTVRNLQALLLQEEQEEKRKKRLEEELTGLRSLVSGGRLREAVAKGEGLLKEFPQEYEVNDLVTYARSEVAQQEQKKNELEREKAVRGLIEAKRYQEAGEAARRALQEFPRQDVFRNLATEAEEKWREQQEKEKVQREVQQRIQEIRSKIKRQELSDAIDMARQTLATFGPDTDVTQLLQAAEVEADQRNRKRDERSQQIKAARSLVEQQDFAGATQILERAIANRIVEPADTQTKMLLAEIAEKEEVFRKEQQKRKREEERKREEKNKEEEKRRKEAQKQSKPESKGPPPITDGDSLSRGRGPGMPAQLMPPVNVPPTIAPTVRESATNIAGAIARPKPSVPVLTPLPAARPSPAIQTQIQIEEHVPAPPIVTPSSSLFRKPAVFALFGLVLVAVASVGIYVHFHKPTSPETPVTVVDNSKTQRDLDLQRESQDLRKQGRLDEALAKDQEIEGGGGQLTKWAQQDVESIERLKQRENSLMVQAKSAEAQNDYPYAKQVYQQVIDLHGGQESAARAASDSVTAILNGETFEKIAQKSFDLGTEAFSRRDYSAAEKFFQEAMRRGPQNWPQNKPARDYVATCVTRLAQQNSLLEAQIQFNAKQYEEARGKASQVAKTKDGDTDFQQKAQALLQRIQGREAQKRDFDDGTELEKNGQRDQAKAKFERVKNPAIGDPDSDLTAKAADGIKRILDFRPPPPPPTNFDAQMTKAEDFVSQGQWDQADSMLAGVPQTQPGYTGLKRKIAEGREEDQAFAEKKTEFTQAAVSTNKETLRGLRPFFMDEANKAGRHDGEARKIVTQLDAALREADPPKPSSGGNTGGGLIPGDNEPEQVQAVLNQFADAVTKGDMDKIKAVRKLGPSDEKKLRDTFKNMPSHGVPTTIKDCKPAHISGNSATVECTVVSGNDNRPRLATFSLDRMNGQWRITSTN